MLPPATSTACRSNALEPHIQVTFAVRQGVHPPSPPDALAGARCEKHTTPNRTSFKEFFEPRQIRGVRSVSICDCAVDTGVIEFSTELQ